MEIVPDTGHWAALGDDVAEVLEQSVDFFLRHGIGVFLLDARKFGGQTMVHHVGIEFIDLIAVA